MHELFLNKETYGEMLTLATFRRVKQYLGTEDERALRVFVEKITKEYLDNVQPKTTPSNEGG